MFHNCNAKTNGELMFYNSIKNKINVIFDVGSKYNSEYLDFEGEVHYFEPMKEYLEKLVVMENKNKKSYFNNFGLSDENNKIFYYPRYESFFNRINSCGVDDSNNRIELNVKKGFDYVMENKVQQIDFLKIDTEGNELKVLKGFEDFLKNINIIQFEYGGTFKDNNTTLADVINYLSEWFEKFSYISPNGLVKLQNYNDHYNYCNIVCFKK